VGWIQQFQRGGVAEDTPVARIEMGAEGLVDGESVRMAKLLVLSGLAASAGEATRKLAENAVSINGEKFSGRMQAIEKLGDEPVLRLGKRAVRVEWVK
jgi:tyrosyl-tRNA synthetase